MAEEPASAVIVAVILYSGWGSQALNTVLNGNFVFQLCDIYRTIKCDPCVLISHSSNCITESAAAA